jgi:hypothetical protein
MPAKPTAPPPPKPEPAPAPSAYEQKREADQREVDRQYWEMMGEIAARIHEIDGYLNARRVLALLNVMRDFMGSITPAEEFILDLLGEYSYRGVTPEYVESGLADFRANFSDGLAVTRRFNATYPELVNGTEAKE